MANMLYDDALEAANAAVDSDTLRYHTLHSSYLQTAATTPAHPPFFVLI